MLLRGAGKAHIHICIYTSVYIAHACHTGCIQLAVARYVEEFWNTQHLNVSTNVTSNTTIYVLNFI